MSRLLALLAWVGFMSGCILDIPPVNEDGYFSCMTDADCEADYVCAAGICSSNAGDTDDNAPMDMAIDRDPGDGERLPADSQREPADDESGRDPNGDAWLAPGDHAPGDTALNNGR